MDSHMYIHGEASVCIFATLHCRCVKKCL